MQWLISRGGIQDEHYCLWKQIPSQFSSVLVLVEMAQHIIKHGDAVKDIAFAVDDLDGIVEVGNG